MNQAEAGGWTPLALAVAMGDKKTVEELLKNSKIDLDVRIDGKTAREIAKEAERFEILEMIQAEQ